MKLTLEESERIKVLLGKEVIVKYKGRGLPSGAHVVIEGKLSLTFHDMEPYLAITGECSTTSIDIALEDIISIEEAEKSEEVVLKELLGKEVVVCYNRSGDKNNVIRSMIRGGLGVIGDDCIFIHVGIPKERRNKNIWKRVPNDMILSITEELNELDDEIIRELVINLGDWLEDTRKLVETFQIKLKESETKNEVMELKRGFLEYLIDCLPVGYEHCYYCLDKVNSGDSCLNCEYAKDHGICSDNTMSDWSELRRVISKMKGIIRKAYSQPDRNEEKHD